MVKFREVYVHNPYQYQYTAGDKNGSPILALEVSRKVQSRRETVQRPSYPFPVKENLTIFRQFN